MNLIVPQRRQNNMFDQLVDKENVSPIFETQPRKNPTKVSEILMVAMQMDK
jgi:hypothetical protein